MFKVTTAAANQIRLSAEQGHTEGMPLRIAATRRADGSFDYGMGFDDKRGDDLELTSEGVKLVIAPGHAPLLKGASMDYVELEPGQFRFVFLNPNDPDYTPPTEL